MKFQSIENRCIQNKPNNHVLNSYTLGKNLDEKIYSFTNKAQLDIVTLMVLIFELFDQLNIVDLLIGIMFNLLMMEFSTKIVHLV